MSDFISRNEILKYTFPIIWNDAIYSVVKKETIESLPSAEPERKKGEWIKVGHWGRCYKCNQCGNTLDFDGVNVGRGDANFCPNCGADMRGEHE